MRISEHGALVTAECASIMTRKQISSEIKQAVRIRAESECPDDFAMQLEIVGQQLTAYRSIEKLTEAYTEQSQ